MRKVAKIDPEREYQKAKELIERASQASLDKKELGQLDTSVDNLATAARILIEREERRRGSRKPPKGDSGNKGKGKGKKGERENPKKLPSERFPNLEISEKKVELRETPTCPCCQGKMKESGLFDTSEKLEVIPKTYHIIRTKRPKFNCSTCHGSMFNTPSEKSIVPTSNYGDSLIIDVGLSKYCDLLPIERYVQIASRQGLEGLPPQSMIELTHHLAKFLMSIYIKLKEEVKNGEILQADETTHKMLEGDETSNWYLWGFLNSSSCYFETHNTRSGDIVTNFLTGSKTLYLVSDGYSGYKKSIKQINKKFNREVLESYCNAHAYRYFKEAAITWKDEAQPFLKLYGDIYELEKSENLTLEVRQKMIPLFKQIKSLCENLDTMPSSGLDKAKNYFLNHYEGLTRCTTRLDLPLDNNLAERQIRGPVIGRKTWYGTHSKRGAQTTAILFSIVQSCRLNKINPRHYFPWVVERIHNGLDPLTPKEFKETQ